MINLDWLLGPRDWCVLFWKGTVWAEPIGELHAGEAVIRTNIRKAHAERLALRLRQEEEV